jgi:hypothetical protein
MRYYADESGNRTTESVLNVRSFAVSTNRLPEASGIEDNRV